MEHWESETLYFDGDAFFESLIAAIGSANQTIDLETYIFAKDPLGKDVLLALTAATRRGVRVRLMLDGLGSSSWSLADAEAHRSLGIEIRFYHPLPLQQGGLSWGILVQPWRWVSGIWKLNRRNHRKSCVIDGKIAFVGGMNIAEFHSRRYSGLRAWRDTSVKVVGADVELISHAFEWSWTRSAGSSRYLHRGLVSPRSSSLVRLNRARRERGAGYRDLLNRVEKSRQRIWITNPYFVPEVALLKRLSAIAKNGVDVRLLVPQKNDLWALKWAVNASYFFLLRSKVRIFEYQASILHAKTIQVDDWALVGSSNLDHRSLFHDLQVDVALLSSESRSAMDCQFLKDLEQSKEIDLGEWEKRPWTGRFLEWFVLIFYRWL